MWYVFLSLAGLFVCVACYRCSYKAGYLHGSLDATREHAQSRNWRPRSHVPTGTLVKHTPRQLEPGATDAFGGPLKNHPYHCQCISCVSPSHVYTGYDPAAHRMDCSCSQCL